MSIKTNLFHAFTSFLCNDIYVVLYNYCDILTFISGSYLHISIVCTTPAELLKRKRSSGAGSMLIFLTVYELTGLGIPITALATIWLVSSAVATHCVSCS